jgi:hypothetical protein
MVFFHKHPVFAASLAITATAALLLAGDGMEPRWPLMWICNRARCQGRILDRN